MSVRIWKDPNSDALRIQYDGEDGPLYEVPDGDAPVPEVNVVPGDWIDLVEATTERMVPATLVLALARFLVTQAQRGAFWTPNLSVGELSTGAQALAYAAARIERLVYVGSFQ